MTRQSIQFNLYKVITLAILGTIFFSTYGFANWYAGTHTVVPEIMFDWEKYIPLLPWTIIPYWSIDLFYALSILICTSQRALYTHVKRLLTAQVICIIFFLVFPLQFSLQRPQIDGVFGLMFNTLMGFDRPFNQAPSLHIVLLIILWVFYAQRTRGILRWFVHVWSCLIGISVLTTWQHHFIDIPTGILVAALCIWMWPTHKPSPLAQFHFDQNKQRKKISTYYALGSIILCTLSLYFKPYGLWLLWPAFSLFMVSCIYAFLDVHAFQKHKNGRFSIETIILLGPYFIFAWLNSRVWTRKHPNASLICLDSLRTTQHFEIYLGRISTRHTLKKFNGLIDTCAELPVFVPRGCTYLFTPILDLTTPTLRQLEQGAKQLQYMTQILPQEHPKILISCALGYSRSACILAAWLIYYHHVRSVQEAIDLIQKSRPFVVIKDHQIQQLETLLNLRNHD
ncbi:phosphatase PAP2/dual specificity phosphatase family protein [Acinetobacter pollinis]|uniref:Phosphatase PAP2/dual specificity phosphatase family protein n=1 Tax=Acinetobacter pollinis TaxID=2605270 RepID=A0ABU6DTT8_9GAMM|nr:phosphatase PAP2/dual specificity phosphatase family protein [Acinetobacter pollinis]MEB5477130.1 phosphatase PAP2/dual specificity phosphatase family protein [Acinetobacter pollinis]